jgi:O-antigen/teichoic acid export membrane protein
VLLAMVVVSVLRVLVFLRLTIDHETIRPLFHFKLWLRLARLGLPLVMSMVLWQAYMSADSVLLAAETSLTTLGIYSLGLQIGTRAAELPAAFGGAVFPALLRRLGAARDSQVLREDVSALLWFQAAFIFPFILFPLTLGFPALIAALLPGYLGVRHGEQALVVLLAAKLLVGTLQLPAQLLIARGRTWLTTLVCGVFVAVAFGAFFLVIRGTGNLLLLAFACWGVYFGNHLALAALGLVTLSGALRARDGIVQAALPLGALGLALTLSMLVPIAPGTPLLTAVAMGTGRTLVAMALWAPIWMAIARRLDWRARFARFGGQAP